MSNTSKDRWDGFGFFAAVIFVWIVVLVIGLSRANRRIDRIEHRLGIAEQQEQGK